MVLFKLVAADIVHIRSGGRSFSDLSSGENFTRTKVGTYRQSLKFAIYKGFYVMIFEVDIESQYICFFLKIKHLQDCLV